MSIMVLFSSQVIELLMGMAQPLRLGISGPYLISSYIYQAKAVIGICSYLIIAPVSYSRVITVFSLSLLQFAHYNLFSNALV